MRVGLIYFGLARGTSITADAIERNIIDCNVRRGVRFTSLASLNLVDRIDNARTGELGVRLDADEAFRLKAQANLLIRQDDVEIAPALAAAQQHPDFYDDDWRSLRNALHQMASLHRAWGAWSTVATGVVDCFLFVRPDLLYLDEMRIPELVANFRGRGSIALPAWHSWGGFNDRFALADPAAAFHYAERLRWVPRYCASNPLHPECFLAYALRRGGCRVAVLPVRARRVRAHGLIREEDFGKTVLNLPARPTIFSFVGQVRFHSVLLRLLQVPALLDLWRTFKALRFRVRRLSTGG